MGNDGIVILDTEPTTVVGKFTWLQILADGTRKWYEKPDGGWQLVKTELGGVTGEYEGTFKKITIVNGIITDFELDV